MFLHNRVTDKVPVFTSHCVVFLGKLRTQVLHLVDQVCLVSAGVLLQVLLVQLHQEAKKVRRVAARLKQLLTPGPDIILERLTNQSTALVTVNQ